MIPLFWLVLTPIILSVPVIFLPQKMGRILAAMAQIGLGVLAVFAFLHVRDYGEQIQSIGGWPRPFGILLRAELFSIDLVVLTVLIFFCVMIYGMKDDYFDRTFVFLLLILEGLIIGIFLSIDLFNIFVLVELCTVVISILIMYKRDGKSIYDGMIYFMTNITAMSFFLFGIAFLYRSLGVVDLISLKILIAEQGSASKLILPYAFLITAVCLKSAVMPLFSWLPKAHGTPGAPIIVSAVLSGLYVKCGIYLFYRIQDIFYPVIDTRLIFLIMGLATALIGIVLAVAQKDLKLILAYHTVSQIGLIMIGMNLSEAYSRYGALYHIINHAFFKATLFLTAGIIIDRYKTRQTDRIRGVFREMPGVATATVLAVLGITGAPLFNGSISKYWIGHGVGSAWVEYALLLINLGTIISFVKYSDMLWRKPDTNAPEYNKQVRKTLSPKTIVVMIMGVICLLGGIFSEAITRTIFNTNLPVELSGYISKAGIYFMSLITGIIIYYAIVKHRPYLHLLRRFELSFNGVCIAIGVFFAGITIVLTIMYR